MQLIMNVNVSSERSTRRRMTSAERIYEKCEETLNGRNNRELTWLDVINSKMIFITQKRAQRTGEGSESSSSRANER